MKLYFSFTDESGTMQLKDSPFYVRGTILIEASIYKELSKRISERKTELNILPNEELKWSDLRLNKNSKRYKKNEFLHDLSRDDKEQFVEEVLSELNNQKCVIIFTITPNDEIKQASETEKDEIVKKHLHYLFQRLQMETQQDNYTLLIMDELGKNKTDKYKAFVSDITSKSDYIDEYNCVYGGVLTDESDKCIGLQIVDYVCGVMNCILRSANEGKTADDFVKNMYSNYVYPMIRHPKNTRMGYGVIEIPPNSQTREHIKKLIKKQK